MYCMGFYWLQGGIHKMDSIRAKFLWRGAEEKFRYHMAKWEMVCRPKDQGGLGIINTQIMNDCLLVKWIWKIHQEPEELWFKILKAKYMKTGNFFNSKVTGSSQFWQGLHKVKHLFKWGAIYKVENGKLCRFWQDRWIKNAPLKIIFDDLYKLVRDQDCTVADCWEDEEWSVDFKRALSIHDYDRWLELSHELSGVILNSNPDKVIWALDSSKNFSTKSLYRFITDRGMAGRVAGHIWKSKLPLKIKFFLWQVFNNKLQVGQSLLRRGWKGSGVCCACGCPETVDHLLFKCPLAKLVWCIIREVFQLNDYPTSLMGFSSVWLQGKGPLPARLLIFLFAGFAWALWTTRNKMAIEK